VKNIQGEHGHVKSGTVPESVLPLEKPRTRLNNKTLQSLMLLNTSKLSFNGIRKNMQAAWKTRNLIKSSTTVTEKSTEEHTVAKEKKMFKRKTEDFIETQKKRS